MMLRTPTDIELEELINTLRHYAPGYDPVAAREYYLRTRELKGRKKAQPERIEEDDPRWDWRTMGNKSKKWQGRGPDPRKGKTREEIAKNARARQRKEMQERINALTDRLNRLEDLIKKRETEEKQENRKSKAKKERAAKEAAKPDSAAEKAEQARDAEKYRDKNQQKLKSKGDDKKSGGGSSKSGDKKSGKKSVSELKAMVTKVKGQIAVAKQKLAAL